MVVIKFCEGLGNTMFQYAFSEVLRQKGRIVKYDLSWYESNYAHNGFELNNIFPIEIKQTDIATTEEIRRLSAHNRDITGFMHKVLRRVIYDWYSNKYYVEMARSRPYTYDERFLQQDDVYLEGFWQNEKYFAGIRRRIKEVFRFSNALDETNKRWLERMIESKNSVSVHIRRGDYLSDKFLPVCGLEYYISACKYLKNRFTDCTFFVFSDDIAWCKEKLISLDAVYIEGNVGENSFIDMQLMSYCKHHIIANSTFSWWGAWLGESENSVVIAPSVWTYRNLSEDSGIVPERWVRM